MTRLLRALSRLFRRLLPRPTPTPSDAPPSNQGAATGQPAPDAILDNACDVPEGYMYIHVPYDEAAAAWSGPLPKAGTVCWCDPATGKWSAQTLGVSDLEMPCASCYVEVAKPTELDAIAARFDARVDAVLVKGRSVPPPA